MGPAQERAAAFEVDKSHHELRAVRLQGCSKVDCLDVVARDHPGFSEAVFAAYGAPCRLPVEVEVYPRLHFEVFSLKTDKPRVPA